MSAKNTDALTNWLIGITIFFSVSPILIFTAISKIEGLSNEERIEYKSQALMTSAGLFLGLAIIINAYYGAKRAVINGKNLASSLEREPNKSTKYRNQPTKAVSRTLYERNYPTWT